MYTYSLCPKRCKINTNRSETSTCKTVDSGFPPSLWLRGPFSLFLSYIFTARGNNVTRDRRGSRWIFPVWKRHRWILRRNILLIINVALRSIKFLRFRFVSAALAASTGRPTRANRTSLHRATHLFQLFHWYWWIGSARPAHHSGLWEIDGNLHFALSQVI